MTARRAAPYAVAAGGAALITAGLAAVNAIGSVSGLSAVYLLLVLWLAARWGRGPAVAGSVAAFLLYDYFLVPPVGTFRVSGPGQLVELVVLLAVALVTSQLAASLRRAQASAEAVAADSRTLYELATAVLRTSEVAAALQLVAGAAARLGSIRRFALVAIDSGRPALLAGDELGDEELRQAAWSHENGRSIGMLIRDGRVKVIRSSGEPAPPTYLPLANGVVVAGFERDRRDPDELRRLAALIGLAGLLLDRRRASLETERARGLEASDRLKAAILSSLSHELKSPIASLRAGLTALKSPQAGLAEDQRELLGDLDRQATRLDRMVGDMLTLSRLEAGVALDREPHGFADLVSGALRRLRPQLKEHDLVLAIPDDLPPVEVDEVQVDRVITNLVENALEWTPPHGVIELGARERLGQLEAWVENAGPAIPPDDLDRVFDTFWTRRTRGTGLGLAICRRVVEAHGGTIAVENRRRGPRFTFTLPVAAVAAER